MREPIVALAQRSTEEHGVPVTATLLLGPTASSLEEYVAARGVRRGPVPSQSPAPSRRARGANVPPVSRPTMRPPSSELPA